MKNAFKKPLLFLLLLALVVSACSAGARTLEGEERDTVLAYAEPMADTLINGLVNGDYTTFATDFDDAMRKGLDEKAFADLRALLESRLGAYQGREVTSVLETSKYTMVIYRLRYEKDDQVTMRLVISRETPHKVTGLWFDSPELRKR